MINFNELKTGTIVTMQSQPYEIIEASLLFKGRGHSILQAKLKNLITGNSISKTFHPSDSFEEAEIEKIKAKFLYSNKDQFWFCEENNSKNRFFISKEVIGESSRFLKQDTVVDGIVFNEKIINILLPIKVKLKVIESPPGIKGDRAQGGTKTIILETGANLNTPLFIEQGDIIEVNTEKGEYTRRVN